MSTGKFQAKQRLRFFSPARQLSYIPHANYEFVASNGLLNRFADFCKTNKPTFTKKKKKKDLNHVANGRVCCDTQSSLPTNFRIGTVQN